MYFCVYRLDGLTTWGRGGGGGFINSSFSHGYCKVSSNHRNSGLMIYVKFKTQVQCYYFACSGFKKRERSRPVRQNKTAGSWPFLSFSGLTR